MLSLGVLLLCWMVPPAVVLLGGAVVTLIGGKHA
ncbi:hypothetical protein EDC28_101220 [Gallaecimonas pentaromativorans]|uniref:Uncharacterized protein n=1 Tax=Gallaecimonas pentaromativorans TaxID=584787 RepID=A0A3N1PF10_9GAMM|nr:hypothetical protein EDC28_101220 [Gallaecimonas pentaromativorans]